MKVKAQTDVSDLRAKLHEFQLVVGREMSGAVRQFARRACVYLANATQPYSGKGDNGKSRNKPAKALGEKAVEVDISKVFYTAEPYGGFVNGVSEIAHKSFAARAAKSKRNFDANAATLKFTDRVNGYAAANNTRALKKIAKDFNWQGVVSFPDPALHQAARSGSRRKVNKRRGNMHLILGGRKTALKTYINKVKKRVGIAKSGWAACAQQIKVDQKQKSTTGIPAWVTRHAGGREGAIVDQSRDKKNPRVRMTNNVPWTSQNLSNSAKKAAVRLAKENFLKYMNTTIRAELRRQRQRVAA